MGTRRGVELAVTGAYAIGVVFQALRRVNENLMGGLDCLELGVEFHLFSGVSVRMELES